MDYDAMIQELEQQLQVLVGTMAGRNRPAFDSATNIVKSRLEEIDRTLCEGDETYMLAMLWGATITTKGHVALGARGLSNHPELMAGRTIDSNVIELMSQLSQAVSYLVLMCINNERQRFLSVCAAWDRAFSQYGQLSEPVVFASQLMTAMMILREYRIALVTLLEE